VGVRGHSDDVETFFDPQHTYAPARGQNAIVGVRQVLDLQVDLRLARPLRGAARPATWTTSTSWCRRPRSSSRACSSPSAFAENRPGERNMGTALASVNRAFPGHAGALEGSYRFYADTYGVTANTVELRWIQKLGKQVTLEPDLRFYRQDAARFYYYNLDDTDIMPTPIPNGNGPGLFLGLPAFLIRCRNLRD
jgi:hypothetical protein